MCWVLVFWCGAETDGCINYNFFATPDASTMDCAATGHDAPAFNMYRVALSIVQFSAAQPFLTGAVPRHHKSLTAISYAGALQQPCKYTQGAGDELQTLFLVVKYRLPLSW